MGSASLTRAGIVAIFATTMIVGVSSSVGAVPSSCLGQSVNLSGTEGADDLYGDGGVDVIALGGSPGSYADHAHGKGSGDVICGNDGYDDIWGQDGGDQVDGGNDHDEVHGVDGNDAIYGAGGGDVFYAGAGADVLRGESQDDFLDASGGADALYGDDGTENLYDGDGYDTINGGNGTDYLFVCDDIYNDEDNALYFVEVVYGPLGTYC